MSVPIALSSQRQFMCWPISLHPAPNEIVRDECKGYTALHVGLVQVVEKHCWSGVTIRIRRSVCVYGMHPTFHSFWVQVCKSTSKFGMRVVQKVRSRIVCLFFFFLGNTEINFKGGECLGRFVQPYCKNLKTMCVFLMILQSSKSGVDSCWCRQIWDVGGNIFFYMLKVSQLLEFYRTGHWKFKMRCPLPFKYEFCWTVFLVSETPQKWISVGKTLKNVFQGQPAYLQRVKKRITSHISKLVTRATGNSTFTKLKRHEIHEIHT